MVGPLRPYEVIVDGNPTTLLLTEADAKARGLCVPAKAATPRANKARRAPNKRA